MKLKVFKNYCCRTYFSDGSRRKIIEGSMQEVLRELFTPAKRSKATPWQVFQKEYGASEGEPNALMHVNLLHACAYWLTVIHL